MKHCGMNSPIPLLNVGTRTNLKEIDGWTEKFADRKEFPRVLSIVQQ